MTVRFYSSEDVGAPVIAGNAAGQLIQILDACLVDGFGSKPGAGWSKPFSGANMAAYQMGAGGSGACLQVDDTASGNNRGAWLRGYEAMTSISGGESPFPTSAQQAQGVRVPTVYGSGGSDIRRWFVVADEHAFYVWIDGDGDPASNINLIFFFGDINSYHADAVSSPLLVGYTSDTSSSTGNLNSTSRGLTSSNHQLTSTSSYQYFARRFDLLPGAVPAGIIGDYIKNGSSSSLGAGGSGALPYPFPLNGGLYLSRVWASEAGLVRGEMPGLWHPCHNRIFPEYPILVDGAGPLSGRKFVSMSVRSGQVLVEVSDTWR